MQAAETEILSPKRQLLRDLGQFRHDPLGYVYYAFPWGKEGTPLAKSTGPKKWQVRFLTVLGKKLRAGVKIDFSEVIRMARGSGNGIGKTALVAWLIKWGMDTHPNTNVVVTANTEYQLKSKTWAELNKWHYMSISKDLFTLKGESMKYADKVYAESWKAEAATWSEKNTEAFAGLHNKGYRIILIFDEASGIPDVIWDTAEGALTDEDTEIIWICTGNRTRNTGRFHECFDGGRFAHRWESECIDSRDVEGVNRQLIDKWVADYGEDSDFVKIHVRGMAPATSTMQLIGVDTVDAAVRRHLREEDYRHMPVILGVDPAWGGLDEFVIFLRQGNYSKLLRTMKKTKDALTAASVISRCEDEYQADAVFIDNGCGGESIVATGQQMGRTWQGVWFSGTSPDEGCANQRAYMWNEMEKWLRLGGCIQRDPRLELELLSVEIKPRPDGKLLLRSKDETGDVLKMCSESGSTGRGDGLALTFAFPVEPKHDRGMGTMGGLSFNQPENYYKIWNPMEAM